VALNFVRAAHFGAAWQNGEGFDEDAPGAICFVVVRRCKTRQGGHGDSKGSPWLLICDETGLVRTGLGMSW
jgi:hypothetical protein